MMVFLVLLETLLFEFFGLNIQNQNIVIGLHRRFQALSGNLNLKSYSFVLEKDTSFRAKERSRAENA